MDNNIPPKNKESQKIIAYIDGFNLYFGLREAGYKRYYWLNILSLISSYVRKEQQLEYVNYYTARINGRDVKRQKRQEIYLRAIETLQKTRIIYGRYQDKDIDCPYYLTQPPICNNCPGKFHFDNEKQTDVNIAIDLINDARDNKFDLAILITGDTDLIPAIKYVKEQCKNKHVFVIFPPNRNNVDVGKTASAKEVLGRKKLKDHQFPDHLADKMGDQIQRPSLWI